MAEPRIQRSLCWVYGPIHRYGSLRAEPPPYLGYRMTDRARVVQSCLSPALSCYVGLSDETKSSHPRMWYLVILRPDLIKWTIKDTAPFPWYFPVHEPFVASNYSTAS